MSLWGGRFEGDLAPAMLALTRSTHFDVRLVRQDCRVLAAHASVLKRAGVLSAADAGAIRDALRGISIDIEAGVYPIDPSDEDIHTTVERVLTERVPHAAGSVRAGLSRNDRVATAFRMWVMEAGSALCGLLVNLVAALTARAREHEESMMPGYTHLQRAQPVTLAATLAAHAWPLVRDVKRFQDALGRTAQMPLGAGALAGSTLGLDHSTVLEELGFEAAVSNSMDAVASRDFAAEFLAACAITGVHLSRLSEDIVLWTSAEFGFATLDDAYATGSSLMPQKKNPDVAELARGKAGRLIGNLAGFLATLKGLPLAYDRDLQEDKEPVFDAADTLLVVLPAITGAIATMRFDTERMRTAASDPMLRATEVAEHLVADGVAFREAHDVVGRAVRLALESGRSPSEMSPEDSHSIHPKLADAWERVAKAGPVAPATGLDAIESWLRDTPR